VQQNALRLIFGRYWFLIPLKILEIWTELLHRLSLDYWVSGLCPSSGILNTRKHNVLEAGSVSVLK
jgi:hypothetical protein